MAKYAHRRQWVILYAVVLSAGLGCLVGWLLDRQTARHSVSPLWRWGPAALWAAGLTLAYGGVRWVPNFYNALIGLLFGGRLPPVWEWDLVAGWVFWSLFIAAGLPLFRSMLPPPWTPRPPAAFPQLRGKPHDLPDGVELGRDRAGQPGVLTDRQANTHVLVLGATGSGKTNALLLIVASALRRGLPLVFVDGKGSVDVRRRLEALCAAAGRNLRVWSFSGPTRYNPLRHGGPTELRDKLIATETWTEPHYRRAAERYLGAVLGALDAADQPATLSAVADLLFPKALEAFARKIPDEDRAQRLYAYIDSLDRSALSAVVGLGSRLATLIESEAGPWLQDGDDDAAMPSVDLLEALTSGEPVLFSLDALRFPGLAAQLGALLLQDLKAVAAELLARGNARPCYLVIDEFNIFEGRQVLALLNKGREAGLCCVLATQDLADVDAAGGPTLVDQVLANTNVKLLLRQEVDAYANRLAMAVGTRTAWLGTHRSSHGMPTGEASMREVDQFIVHPNLLKQLPPHQAVLVRKAPELVAQQLRLWAAEG